MRYKDYKVEDQVFTNKEDWTDEEKREFLDTCPESKDTAEKIDVLRKVIADVESGVLKCSKYHDIHARSAEAYPKKSTKFLRFRGIGYYGSKKHLNINIDGIQRELRDIYSIKNIIETLDDLNRRFENVARIYKEKESRWKRNHDENVYEEENRERIIANRIAEQWLNAIRIEIPTEVKEDRVFFGREEIPKYVAETKRFNGYDFAYINKYGELEFNGRVISKEDAEYISKVIERAMWDVLPIMNKMKAAIEDLREKYMKGE